MLYDGGFFTSVMGFYMSIGGFIVKLFFSIIYYALVCFVIFSLYKIIHLKILQYKEGNSTLKDKAKHYF
jgi:hypothetical protein